MNIHADTSKKNKSEAVANALRQNKHNSKTTFQFVDNRSEAIVQRKLQTMMQTNLPIKQIVATEDATKQKDHSLPSDLSTETIQFVNKKKGAAIGGVLGGLGYAAFAVANSWNPLGLGMLAAAGVGAVAGGILGNSEEPEPEPEHEHAQRSPRNIRERFDYDSEDLSDESGLSDASEQQEMVRAHGTRTERHLSVGVYSAPRAVRRIARSIRRFRRGEATESDRAPILTRVGSSVLEMAPSHWRRDVGVYQTEELPDGSRRRVGRATPYGSLGRELDRDRDDEGLSQDDMDEAMRGRLMGSPSSSGRVRSPAARRRLDEASGIMMSDMARGSRGAELADEMFEQPESFGRRFADRTGTYRPAHKGGSKYIQEETRERKKRDRGGSDSDTE